MVEYVCSPNLRRIEVPELNRERLIMMLDAVRRERDTGRWYQGHYRVRKHPIHHSNGPCGTAMCAAGWAIEEHPDYQWLVPDEKLTESSLSFSVLERCTGPDGETVWADTAARRILGLTEVEASILFNGDNTFERVEGIVETLLNGCRDGDLVLMLGDS